MLRSRWFSAIAEHSARCRYSSIALRSLCVSAGPVSPSLPHSEPKQPTLKRYETYDNADQSGDPDGYPEPREGGDPRADQYRSGRMATCRAPHPPPTQGRATLDRPTTERTKLNHRPRRAREVVPPRVSPSGPPQRTLPAVLLRRHDKPDGSSRPGADTPVIWENDRNGV